MTDKQENEHMLAPAYITKEDGNHWLIICTSDHRDLCYCSTRERAAQVLRAINNHEALLEALKVVRDGYLAERGSDFDWNDWYKKAEKAISQAEGKNP